MEEAFKLLDPEGKGELDIKRLKELFMSLGYGEIEKKDTEILVECLDTNGDGIIDLTDFKEIFRIMKEKEKEEAWSFSFLMIKLKITLFNNHKFNTKLNYT